jgi:hypothetical protein
MSGHFTPEEIALIESGNVLEDEVDLVAEQVAAGNIVSQEHFSEVHNKLEEICQKIETLNLSTENPVLAQLATEVSVMKQQMMELKHSMDTMSKNLALQRLEPEPLKVEVVMSEPPKPDELTEEQRKDVPLEVVETSEVEQPALEKTRRYQRL